MLYLMVADILSPISDASDRMFDIVISACQQKSVSHDAKGFLKRSKP